MKTATIFPGLICLVCFFQIDGRHLDQKERILAHLYDNLEIQKTTKIPANHRQLENDLLNSLITKLIDLIKYLEDSRNKLMNDEKYFQIESNSRIDAKRNDSRALLYRAKGIIYNSASNKEIKSSTNSKLYVQVAKKYSACRKEQREFSQILNDSIKTVSQQLHDYKLYEREIRSKCFDASEIRPDDDLDSTADTPSCQRVLDETVTNSAKFQIPAIDVEAQLVVLDVCLDRLVYESVRLATTTVLEVVDLDENKTLKTSDNNN